MSERDWQPISTAPKDGTPVLIWVDKMAVTASFDEDELEWFNGNWGLGFAEAEQPTHWMPLPQPPSIEE